MDGTAERKKAAPRLRARGATCHILHREGIQLAKNTSVAALACTAEFILAPHPASAWAVEAAAEVAVEAADAV